MHCDILKSKLILCEWNAFYFIEIAFIGFTLHEIKQCIVFVGTPGVCVYIYIYVYNVVAFSLGYTCRIWRRGAKYCKWSYEWKIL